MPASTVAVMILRALSRSFVVVSNDTEYLVRLREDYILLGFDTSLERGLLRVYPRRRRKPRPRRKFWARLMGQ